MTAISSEEIRALEAELHEVIVRRFDGDQRSPATTFGIVAAALASNIGTAIAAGSKNKEHRDGLVDMVTVLLRQHAHASAKAMGKP